MKSYLGNTDCIKKKVKTQIQTMCIFCLHCMISIKKTCTVHRVTANVISFQWGDRFCLCTLALAHNENFNGTTAACAFSLYWYSIMAVLSRLNNIYGIVLHADHIFYCALMLINVYVQLFTPCTVIEDTLYCFLLCEIYFYKYCWMGLVFLRGWQVTDGPWTVKGALRQFYI